MRNHPTLTPVAFWLALMLLLAACLSLGCSDAKMEEALLAAEQELAQCRKEKEELQEEIRSLRMKTQQRQAQPAAPAANADVEAMKQRLKQLEYTLNRAYIDMKAALVEREQCQKRHNQTRRERDELRRKLDMTAGAR